MKENLMIVCAVLLLFIISTFIRTRYKLSNSFNFWSSLVTLLMITAMLINDIFFKNILKNDPLQSNIILLLVYLVLLCYLSFKGLKSFRQMRK